MAVKNFYRKYKKIIVYTMTVLIFLILMTVSYFIVKQYEGYDDIKEKNIEVLNKDIKNLESKIKSKEKDVVNKEKEYEELKGKKNVILEKFKKLILKGKKETAGIIYEYINNSTGDLDIVEYKYYKNNVTGRKIKKLPHNIELKGNYQSTLNFLNLVEQQQYFKIRDVELVLEDGEIKTVLNGDAFAVLTEEDKDDDEVDDEVDDENNDLNTEHKENAENNKEDKEDVNVIARIIPFGKPMTYEEYKEVLESELDDDNDLNVPVNNNLKRYNPIDKKIDIITDYKEVKNDVSDKYTKQGHSVSISALEGSKVKSVDFGTVIYVGDFGSYNKTVMVKNLEENIMILYGNLKNIKVSKGQKLTKGRVIAQVAGVGNEKQAHLKFAVSVNNVFVDPKGFLDVN